MAQKADPLSNHCHKWAGIG